MEPQTFPHRLLSAAASTGVDVAVVDRNLSVLNRCVRVDDEPVLIARADRSGDRSHYLLLLTADRLVVVAESRVLRRRRLHLNSDARDLVDVLWTAEPALGGLAFSATAIDGVREHFWIRTTDPEGVAAALSAVFRPVAVAAV